MSFLFSVLLMVGLGPQDVHASGKMIRPPVTKDPCKLYGEDSEKCKAKKQLESDEGGDDEE